MIGLQASSPIFSFSNCVTGMLAFHHLKRENMSWTNINRSHNTACGPVFHCVRLIGPRVLSLDDEASMNLTLRPIKRPMLTVNQVLKTWHWSAWRLTSRLMDLSRQVHNDVNNNNNKGRPVDPLSRKGQLFSGRLVHLSLRPSSFNRWWTLRTSLCKRKMIDSSSGILWANLSFKPTRWRDSR